MGYAIGPCLLLIASSVPRFTSNFGFGVGAMQGLVRIKQGSHALEFRVVFSDNKTLFRSNTSILLSILDTFEE